MPSPLPLFTATSYVVGPAVTFVIDAPVTPVVFSVNVETVTPVTA